MIDEIDPYLLAKIFEWVRPDVYAVSETCRLFNRVITDVMIVEQVRQPNPYSVAKSVTYLNWARLHAGFKYTCMHSKIASCYGQIEVMKILIRENCPMDEFAIINIARSGNKAMLRLFENTNAPIGYEGLRSAIVVRDLELLDLLYKVGPVCEDIAQDRIRLLLFSLVLMRDFRILEFVGNKHPSWRYYLREQARRAVETDNIEIVRYVIGNCHLTSSQSFCVSLYKIAARNGNLAILKHLYHIISGPVPAEVIDIACSAEIVEWASRRQA